MDIFLVVNIDKLSNRKTETMASPIQNQRMKSRDSTSAFAKSQRSSSLGFHVQAGLPQEVKTVDGAGAM